MLPLRSMFTYRDQDYSSSFLEECAGNLSRTESNDLFFSPYPNLSEMDNS